MNRLFSVLIVLSILPIFSCNREPGSGGNANVKGRVFAHYYNNTFTMYYGSDYAQNHAVYLIYGEDNFYAERTTTNFNGVYSFSNLKKGQYSVYVYSRDSSESYPYVPKPVFMEFEIKKNAENLILDDIIIFK